jgi:hypothetical protein
VVVLPTPWSPESDLLFPRAAGLKTWSQFSRDAQFFSFSHSDAVCTITFYKRHGGGGWVPDPNRTIKLPPGMSLDAFCDHAVAVLQANAA